MTAVPQQPTPDEFLMGGGVRSFKFETEGQVAKGTITDLSVQQQRDFATGLPKFWDDGKPMMQLRIVLTTDERDGPDDDGTRAIYAKGESQKAIREAVKAAGAKTIEVGGTLALAFTGLGEKKGQLNAPKLYRSQYVPPTTAPQSVDADDLI